jgi:hypothetical protein
MNAAKKLTLRLPLGLYERASRLAATRGQSLNRLFQDGLQLLDSQDRDQRLFDDFTAIAEAQGAESDVGFALAAQTETLAQVLTISKQRLHQQWGRLSAAAMSKVEAAVKTALGM